MVALGADYLLHQDDTLDSKHCCPTATSPRTTLHSINIARAPAKFTAEPLPYPRPPPLRWPAIIPPWPKTRATRKN